MSFKLAPEDLY